MDDITGRAAHPSMQRKTTEELRAKLAETRERRHSALQSFPASADRDELIEGYDEQIAAHELALQWRLP